MPTSGTKSKIEDLSKQQGKGTLLYWHGGVVKRYERQLACTAEPYTMELHVIQQCSSVIFGNEDIGRQNISMNDAASFEELRCLAKIKSDLKNGRWR